jgi:hypothetical protein
MSALVDDFNDNWTDRTIAQFNTALSGVAFNEFTVIPLMEEI